MYDTEVTQLPRDEGHLWEMIKANFEHAKHVLNDFHLETREEALSGVHRNVRQGKAKIEPITILAYRNVHDDYDQREYAYELGRATLPIVERLIEERQLDSALFQSWGVLQFCHGYLASHLLATNDDLASQRGGKKHALEISVDNKRIWVAQILRREIRRGLSRKAAEREVAKTVILFVDRGGYGTEYPASWFAEILNEKQVLKTTYGKSQMPGKSLDDWANRAFPALPPTEA